MRTQQQYKRVSVYALSVTMGQDEADFSAALVAGHLVTKQEVDGMAGLCVCFRENTSLLP